MTDQQSDFLQRWSRRKQGLGEDAAQELPLEAQPAQQLDVDASGPSEPAEDPIPDLDSLCEASDFSRFMKSDVAEAIRRQALKKLFHLPEFNVTDGLNDYDDDYTRFAPLGDLITHEMRAMLERWSENNPGDESADQQTNSMTKEAANEESEAEFDHDSSETEEISEEMDNE